MDAKERRKQYRESIREQQEDSYSRKDQSGKFKTIFNEDCPNDLFWKCLEGKHELNFIPFIAGSQHPHRKEGKSAYMVDVWRHEKIGPSENAYICLNLTFGQECPICEEQAQLKKADAPDNEVKALNAKHRTIYNIQCLDNDKEKAKGIQIWDSPYHSFERLLVERAEEKKGGKVYFSDPDDGKIVSFKRKGMGPLNTEFLNIDFEDREKPISDELLDKAYHLDMLLHIPTYEEVEAALKGKVVEKEEKAALDKRASEKVEEKGDDNFPDNECPHDHVFAEEFGNHDECAECVNFIPCEEGNKEFLEERKKKMAAARKAKEEAKREPEPPPARRSSRSATR